MNQKEQEALRKAFGWNNPVFDLLQQGENDTYRVTDAKSSFALRRYRPCRFRSYSGPC
ncbi:hypothetical protein [Salinithrix halophila]|uniref:Uncharacterized protein n=1 Tax=Salinithrix halophila TaxID=1485204 RepID=A0ABV8JKZ4_9BACL